MLLLPGVLLLLVMLFVSSASHASPPRHHRLETQGTMDRKPDDHQGTLDRKPDDRHGYVRFLSSDDFEMKWKEFKTEHEKAYKNFAEEENRKKIFAENLKEIALHNERYAKGIETYEQGINQFADLTHSEFVKQISCRLTGNTSMEDQEKSIGIPEELLTEHVLPKSVDWRPTGAVTRVKNQGQCGSCWAFGAVGSLEGQMYLKSRGSMVPLSEQNLVDCSHRNGGCKGGLAYRAYLDIRDQGGIDTEDSYQYEAQDGRCRYNPRLKGGHVSGVVTLPRGSESYLERAVAFIGPIEVSIDASDFQFYRSGILSGGRCSNNYWRLNHSVLLVGYKTAAPGRDYWIVKNSWSTRWGMDGYVLMSRNKGNQCGIATDAVFPIV